MLPEKKFCPPVFKKAWLAQQVAEETSFMSEPVVKTVLEECKPYTTRDGSIIRELVHPALMLTPTRVLPKPWCLLAVKPSFTCTEGPKKFTTLPAARVA